MSAEEFPDIEFAGQLRTSQAEVVAIARQQLSAGSRRLHIVAPPGSGKTVLGLYLWAELVRRPAVVLSPNSAIQSQWAARTDLFRVGRIRRPLDPDWISTTAARPALLTSLTYQSLTLPRRGDEDLNEEARQHWLNKLVEKQQAQDILEAEVWLEDLQRQNRDYFEKRLGLYRKEVRDRYAAEGQNLQMLHRSSWQALEAAREAGVGVLILDECHHLAGHWGRVLHQAVEMLGNPIVIGLTATPPDLDDYGAEQIQHYRELLGEVVYEVPVPSVVKDGFLAPYQDLVQFVRPLPTEVDFLSRTDREFREVLKEANGRLETRLQHRAVSRTKPSVTDSDEAIVPGQTNQVTATADNENANESSVQGPGNLVPWLFWALENQILPQGRQKDWKSFARKDPTFADVGRQVVLSLGLPLPVGVPSLTLPEELLPIRQRNLQRLRKASEKDRLPALSADGACRLPSPEVLLRSIHTLPLELVTPILDRFIRHRLRRSPVVADQQLGERFISRLRILGVQITETGFQACASPVNRVLAYSSAKLAAMIRILQQEQQLLGQRLRAVVVTDYEKTSVVSAELDGLLDEQSGGAVAAFRALLADQQTNELDPVLLTGSTVLVDADLDEQLRPEAEKWLEEQGCQVELRSQLCGEFVQLEGSGADWCPRVYVAMLTEMFQRGVTRCLVGTRGLLGEGWDASRTNVLIDLTTVTTSMSINQLRGRSIRLDRDWPEKVANNWDVVCIAPQFTKGLDDFRRFRKKHTSLFGVTDDGEVEKGAGHVHPVFEELQPEDLELTCDPLNQEMLRRASGREACRASWKIGQPYLGQLAHSVELQEREKPSGGRPVSTMGWWPRTWTIDSLGETLGQVVLEALVEVGKIQPGEVVHGKRQDHSVRLYLKTARPEDAAAFAEAISQLMGPIDEARYIIPREVSLRQANWLSRWFPDFVAVMLENRRQVAIWHAVPQLLAGNKAEVSVFQAIWNRRVSPGQALFAHRGAGQKQVLDAVAAGMTPDFGVNQTEIFR